MTSSPVATPVPPSPVDAAATEAFAERMLGAFNDAALVLMTSVGHRVGLFDAMADGRWCASVELAAAAGLDERYVREWLSAMTTGGVVEIDGEDRFRLPPERAALLTRGADENLAVFAQFIPVLASVENDLIECFRNGGGVPYERFHDFHRVMAEDSAQSVVAALDDRILPLAPDLRERLEAGIDAADLGCGCGRAVLALAERFPASRFVGYDLSPEAIGSARAAAEAAGLENVRFEVRDLSDFDETAEPEAFDLATTFDAVHDQARPGALLRGIRRTLRPGGVYLMQDIDASSRLADNLDHPLAALLYTVSCMHCMTVSLAQGGEGLGTMWGREQALALLAESGFDRVELRKLEHDIMNVFYVARIRGEDRPAASG